MPKQEQKVILDGLDKESIVAICYSCFKKLGWEILLAGQNGIIGHTPQSWKSHSQQVIATTIDNELTIVSEMTHGEAIDIGGKNKKNIAAFLEAFNSIRQHAGVAELEQSKIAVDELRIISQEKVAQDARDAAEVDAAMNLSGGNLYLTYAIMAINVLVFVLMAINGAGLFEPNGMVHIKWGSNFAPLTLSGDWWRLISCTFLHFGIIHLAMNMYCLYTVSIYLEPMLGKIKFITAYLCTGILSSLASLWWHTTPVNSAGASGAVFGMYGVFLAFLTSSLIPKQARQPLLQSIGIFVVFNLVYGLKGGVDNAAHVGGLLSGFAIGYIYILGARKEKEGQQPQWILPLVILLSIGSAAGYLSAHKSSMQDRSEIVEELAAADFKDNKKFDDAYSRFIDIQNKAIAVKADGNTNELYKKDLLDISLPNWEQAAVLAKQMQGYNVSVPKQKKAVQLYEYAMLRQEEAKAIIEILNGKSTGSEQQLKDIAGKLNKLMKEME